MAAAAESRPQALPEHLIPVIEQAGTLGVNNFLEAAKFEWSMGRKRSLHVEGKGLGVSR